jgi:rod shape-determining protein MreD
MTLMVINSKLYHTKLYHCVLLFLVIGTQALYGCASGAFGALSSYMPHPFIFWVVFFTSLYPNALGAVLAWFLGVVVDLSSASYTVGSWATSYALYFVIVIYLFRSAKSISVFYLVCLAVLGSVFTDLINSSIKSCLESTHVIDRYTFYNLILRAVAVATYAFFIGSISSLLLPFRKA